jgi:GNAT superfamily N-acetyltransferase
MPFNSTKNLTIRDAKAADEREWREMWQGYCGFYQVTVSPDVTASVWTRIMDSSSAIHALIAESESGHVLGFANIVLHPYTWGTGLACYLEDLYVKTEARARGVGRALIDAIIDRAKENGWQRVYWLTATGNETARVLYDSYCLADDFVRYTVRL